MTKALKFQLQKKCKSTRARCGLLTLLQPFEDGGEVVIETPIFMPVGTHGTMKGMLPEQVESTGCKLLLSNNYHLASRPGTDVIERIGGLHKFMNWPNAILTDSGGFQMVSLSQLTKVTEQGVTFQSPYSPDTQLNFTPEKATESQHEIGANIIMQLDDVVSSMCPDRERVEQASLRSIRWYDRCRKIHEDKQRQTKQNLFPIVQGGLDKDFRQTSAKELLSRDPVGIAIGGLSGGEEKDKFVDMVACSTECMPDDKPRYLMGVGHAIDMLMSVALGCDMFDCVYPTRTARFGFALVGFGAQMSIKNKSYANDFNPISDQCHCVACKRHTRAYIHHLMRFRSTVGCHLLTLHNLQFQMDFMEKIRKSIREDKFKEFIDENLTFHFETEDNYPPWIIKALELLNLK